MYFRRDRKGCVKFCLNFKFEDYLKNEEGLITEDMFDIKDFNESPRQAI